MKEVLPFQLKTLLGQDAGGLHMAKMMLLMFCPQLFYKLELAFVPQETTNFFANMIRTSIKSRKESNAKMNDFIDFLTDMAKNVEKSNNEDFESEFERDAKLEEKENLTTHFMSDQKLEDLIIAQGLLVFFAGNDTTSSTLAIVFYFLAQHTNLQERVYKEIAVSFFNASTHLSNYFNFLVCLFFRMQLKKMMEMFI